MSQPALGLEHGQITTFYSFKGGVGRTMALANVAFLAAMNGLRVLVMDWDLEAPGLSYYFRGLPDQERARAIKSARGVLDLVWQWRDRLNKAQDAADVDALVSEFRAGEPFESCSKPLIDSTKIPEGARLDIIGAGSQSILTPSPESYAEALAKFSWTDFFEDYGGGLFIDSLRHWCKRHYDIILVDSRTGYADVAGICTMQIPDVVALTFIFNRQNIEGISAVAKSVSATRDKQIRLRAVPMRLSREGTLDEADARSRAIRDLQRSGAFTAEEAESDMELLAIRAAPSVPFYEALAPFAVPNPASDQLSLDYKRLAEAICRHKLEMPEISPEWRESVRRRLEPKLATVAYVQELHSADAARALEELERLIDGALEAELHEGSVEREYIESLVQAAFDFEQRGSEVQDPERSINAARKAIDLIRLKYDGSPNTWRDALVSALETYNDIYSYSFTTSDSAHHLRELDKILGDGPQTPTVLLRRVGYLRELANTYKIRDQHSALVAIKKAEDFLNEIPASENPDGVSLAWADTLLQKSQLLEDRAAAYEAAKLGLDWAKRVRSNNRAAQLPRIEAELNVRLALLEQNPEIAADYALQALSDESSAMVIYRNLRELVDILLASETAPTRVLALIPTITTTRSKRNPPTFFFSRSPQLATAYCQAAARIAVEISTLANTTEATRAVESLLSTAAAILVGLKRRMLQFGVPRSPRQGAGLMSAIGVLLDAAAGVGVSSNAIDALTTAAAELEPLARARRSPEE